MANNLQKKCGTKRMDCRNRKVTEMKKMKINVII